MLYNDICITDMIVNLKIFTLILSLCISYHFPSRSVKLNIETIMVTVSQGYEDSDSDSDSDSDWRYSRGWYWNQWIIICLCEAYNICEIGASALWSKLIFRFRRRIQYSFPWKIHVNWLCLWQSSWHITRGPLFARQAVATSRLSVIMCCGLSSWSSLLLYYC